MYLSKSLRSFLILIVCAAILQACSSTANNANVSTSPPPEEKSEFPFSTKEPPVYQGDFYAGTSDYQNHWFVAKNGDKWRVDFFKDKALDWTEMKTDKSYFVDHKRKVYAQEPEGDPTKVGSSYFTSLLSGFFKGKAYKEFEDLGKEGNLKKYKVHDSAGSKDETLLYVDETSGMVVKQEFVAHNDLDGTATTAKYVYEIKDLKLNVDDKVFQFPDGYKQVSWEEYSSAAKAK